MDQTVVVAHDYFTQCGGAERVAIEIARCLNASRIITAFHSPTGTYPELSNFEVESSLLNSVGMFRNDPRLALPFLPYVWSLWRPVDARLIVCSSSAFSHGIRVVPGAMKIVYCHNPPRWLYQPDDFFQGYPAIVRYVAKKLGRFRRWDQSAAKSAHLYLANSTSVAQRIKSAYGIDAIVLHPPVCVQSAGEQKAIDDLPQRFFLSVSRPRGYKGVDALIDAFGRVRDQALVIVGGERRGKIAPNVTSVGRVSEPELRWLYTQARALVSVSHEDFGLTPVEANAFGTPSLVLRAGGFLDSTAEGISGCFINDGQASTIADAIIGFPDDWDRAVIRRHAERFSRKAFCARLTEIIESVEQRMAG